jgi:hypothetical protein
MSWVMVEAPSPLSWRRLPAPDFRLPSGRSRLAGSQEPPSRFLRWSDRIETVLPVDQASVQKVTRLCQAMGSKPPPTGKVYRGCTHTVAGRCLITRIDDPSVARHELAHCNGWPPDHPS